MVAITRSIQQAARRDERRPTLACWKLPSNTREGCCEDLLLIVSRKHRSTDTPQIVDSSVFKPLFRPIGCRRSSQASSFFAIATRLLSSVLSAGKYSDSWVEFPMRLVKTSFAALCEQIEWAVSELKSSEEPRRRRTLLRRLRATIRDMDQCVLTGVLRSLGVVRTVNWGRPKSCPQTMSPNLARLVAQVSGCGAVSLPERASQPDRAKASSAGRG